MQSYAACNLNEILYEVYTMCMNVPMEGVFSFRYNFTLAEVIAEGIII